MQIGAVSEQLTVTANASMVETHSTGIGQVIDNQRVVELPLNGRQATELIFLSGLATSAPAADLNTNKNYPTVTISVAGGQANGMTYIMDGGTHNDPFNNLNLPTPFPDALQEFKVETSALPARYGHHASSAVNLVTKSGTNDFAARVFEFVRNYRFNARNALGARPRQPRAQPVRRRARRSGAAATRSFFFGGYQGRLEQPTRRRPSAGCRRRRCWPATSPRLASPACNGGRQVDLRAPFVNNRIAPVAAQPGGAQLRALPADRHRSVRPGPVRHPQRQHRAPGAWARSTTRSTSSTSCLRATCSRVYENPATYDGQNVLTLSRTGQKNIAHSLVTGHNWLPTSSLVNSLQRHLQQDVERPAAAGAISPPPSWAATSPARSRATWASASPATASRSAPAPPTLATSTRIGFQLADDLDLVRGNHQISAGGTGSTPRSRPSTTGRPTAQFTFNGQSTGPVARRLHGRRR